MKFDILKQLILNCIEDLKGQNIVCLNINTDKYKYSITNLMIFCTGQSSRHVVSIAQNILKKLRQTSFHKFYGIEGVECGEWVLVDLGDIIIHIMKSEIRKLYELEKLWN
ncbi:conserved hypothetical protein [Candidatus Blochmanniella vafra str. BVAF]|uniref:Ribosomal silencing factor RsfS n=1 Tax=Blochmanniella vafra (strain BVAF) TaxID=859654 RepID=E8Q6W3_BLOVB|nr:ribosome silencing factor [Candidatus Blochmannia vafer]ADV33710.1 conserved hypothetical protein [Candidatus Blochmannia vafer str. BVAF]